jgi:hypothetical protein
MAPTRCGRRSCRRCAHGRCADPVPRKDAHRHDRAVSHPAYRRQRAATVRPFAVGFITASPVRRSAVRGRIGREASPRRPSPSPTRSPGSPKPRRPGPISSRRPPTRRRVRCATASRPASWTPFDRRPKSSAVSARRPKPSSDPAPIAAGLSAAGQHSCPPPPGRCALDHRFCVALGVDGVVSLLLEARFGCRYFRTSLKGDSRRHIS